MWNGQIFPKEHLDLLILVKSVDYGVKRKERMTWISRNWAGESGMLWFCYIYRHYGLRFFIFLPKLLKYTGLVTYVLLYNQCWKGLWSIKWYFDEIIGKWFRIIVMLKGEMFDLYTIFLLSDISIYFIHNSLKQLSKAGGVSDQFSISVQAVLIHYFLAVMI